MRKWMRDRLKRRKKPSDKAETKPAPAPLQPAFYDIEPQKERPDAEPESASEAASEPAPVDSSAPAEEVQPVQAQQNAPKRRRRSRGRRGRTPKRQAQPASEQAPVSVSEPPSVAEAPSAEAPAATPVRSAPARASRGTVILAIGLPGSGKSSWFKRHNITPLSSDLLRALLFDDPTEQRFQDLVFSNLRSMLRARLIARRPLNYVDATNLTSHDRHGWIKLAKDHGYDVQAVFFDVPLEVCLERNRKRERVVGEDVMQRMASKLKPPTFEEGFSKITVVRVKQKE